MIHQFGFGHGFLLACELDVTRKICTLKDATPDQLIVNNFADVTEVIFKNAKFTKTPQKVIDRFAPLQRLDMSKNSFAELNFAEVRDTLTLLAILDVSTNNITELQSNTFAKTTNLKELYLSRNQIEALPSTVFFALPKLRLLDLSHNKIKAISQDNMFGFLKSLQFIYLNHNGINRLRTSFGNVTTLVEFDGSHNDLKDWSLTFVPGSTMRLNLAYCGLKDSYTSSSDKEELNLEGNMIEVMKITGKVTRLRANNNIIRQVEIDPSIELEALELANNYISDIGNITKVDNLQILDLSGNRLKNTIKGDVFSKLTALTYLSLRDTDATITDDLLEKNTRLMYLDISKNRIGKFDLKVLKFLVNLEILKLDSNDLTEIIGYEDVKEFLPELSSIGLSNNMFSCSYLQKLLASLQNSLVEVAIPLNYLEYLFPNIKGLKCISDVANLTNQLITMDNVINLQDEKFKDDVRMKMRSIQDDMNSQKQSLNSHDAQLQEVAKIIKDSIKDLSTNTQNQLANLSGKSDMKEDLLKKLQELQVKVEQLNSDTDNKLDKISGNMDSSTVDKLVMNTQDNIAGLKSEVKAIVVLSVILLIMSVGVIALFLKEKLQRRSAMGRSYSEQHLTL